MKPLRNLMNWIGKLVAIWLRGGVEGAPTAEDNPEHFLVISIRDKLRAGGFPGADDTWLDGLPAVLMRSPIGPVTVFAGVREMTAEKVHAHVVCMIPRRNPSSSPLIDTLEACVLGYGDTLDLAVKQAAEIWLKLVGLPVLSLAFGHALTGVEHFSGTERWGVPGRHGFVGPFSLRGDHQGLCTDELGECDLFRFDGYPEDPLRHLAKITLVVADGRWCRTLEIDGHDLVQVDENWDVPIPVPSGSVVCVRFAVFELPERPS